MNKRLLHICLSSGWGGLEMYPVRVGAGMRERGMTIYGLALAGSRVASEMRASGIEVYEVRSRAGALLGLWPLRHWLQSRRIELIHCHKSSDLLLAALLKCLMPVRLVFTEHMGGHRPKRDLFHRWIYGKVDLLLSISDETRRRNLKALPIAAERVHRLWLGTVLKQCDETPVAIRRELGLPEGCQVLGMVGRIDRAKGQRDLLAAFLLLRARFPALHLLIVGGLAQDEGADETVVRQLENEIGQAAATASVHLVGFQRDTPRMLQCMDIVAIPSHNEAFGLTVIEAMAAGRAIIGANTGAIPEILAGTGLLASPTDPDAMATQIATLLEDDLLRTALGHQARQRAEAEFSMASHLDRLAIHYGDYPQG